MAAYENTNRAINEAAATQGADAAKVAAARSKNDYEYAMAMHGLSVKEKEEADTRAGVRKTETDRIGAEYEKRIAATVAYYTHIENDAKKAAEAEKTLIGERDKTIQAYQSKVLASIPGNYDAQIAVVRAKHCKRWGPNMAFSRPKTMSILLGGTATDYAERVDNVPLPSFGYTTELQKALVIQRFTQAVDAYDRGAVYDKRLCSFKLLVPTRGTEREASAHALYAFFESRALRPHWDSKYVMRLPEKSGFHPAGPDRPDSGDFSFSLQKNIHYSEMTTTPFQMATLDFKILFNNAPYATIQKAPADFGGTFGIGDVRGIRSPKISPRQEQNIRYVTTIGAKTYYMSSSTDEFTTDLTVSTTTGKMAELMNFIANNRGEAFTVYSHRNEAIFGAYRLGLTDTVQNRVKFLQSSFIATHSNYNLWSMPVSLWDVNTGGT